MIPWRFIHFILFPYYKVTLYIFYYITDLADINSLNYSLYISLSHSPYIHVISLPRFTRPPYYLLNMCQHYVYICFFPFSFSWQINLFINIIILFFKFLWIFIFIHILIVYFLRMKDTFLQAGRPDRMQMEELTLLTIWQDQHNGIDLLPS